MEKTERITFVVTPEQRSQYEDMARRHTEGNISMMIRKAMEEYERRHQYTTDITTEYELYKFK